MKHLYPFVLVGLLLASIAVHFVERHRVAALRLENERLREDLTAAQQLVVGLASLTVGLVLVSFGIRWLFFSGLALILLSGMSSFRRRTRVGSILAWLFCVGAVLFLVWFSSYGVQKPPLTALAAVWLAGIAEEFYGWRTGRITT